MTRILAKDNPGLVINACCPGWVKTDMMPAESPMAQGLARFLVERTRAEERAGTTQDVADTVLFLASEKSRWVTGQVIDCSGGITRS